MIVRSEERTRAARKSLSSTSLAMVVIVIVAGILSMRERKIKQFEWMRLVDTFAQRINISDVFVWMPYAVCNELCHAFVRYSFMCMCLRLTSIHRDNKGMWDISAFFSCHFAFISCAFTVERISGRPFMWFGTTSTMHKYFTCLTWLFCADRRHHQQHTCTVFHIPLGLQKQNRFICIILSVNAFWEWMKLILWSAPFAHLMIQSNLHIFWVFFSFFFFFNSFSMKCPKWREY